ncbi:hypothetical protein P746_00216 [Enterococcus faecalis CBRD01]|nr:hypothetical protein P746_00216 [Enterococcus faecalis CBRD01]
MPVIGSFWNFAWQCWQSEGLAHFLKRKSIFNVISKRMGLAQFLQSI